jgi:hypothetical protein
MKIFLIMPIIVLIIIGICMTKLLSRTVRFDNSDDLLLLAFLCGLTIGCIIMLIWMGI